MKTDTTVTRPFGRTRKTPDLKRKCELCKVNGLNGANHSICDKCDGNLRVEQEKEAGTRASLWAAKHKCRTCGCGLPESRYFECSYCQPGHTTEDDFDDSADNNTHPAQPTVRHLLPTDKFKCRVCAETKSMDGFYRSYAKSGYMTTCRKCHNKDRVARIRAKTLAARVAA